MLELYLIYFFSYDKNLKGGAKRAVRRIYLEELLAKMVEPTQADFRFESHRDEDDHCHEADFGTEIRSAAMQKCKEIFRTNRQEYPGDIVDEQMSKLSLGPNVRPIDEKKLIRCLQRERRIELPQIDFTDPAYIINLGLLEGTKIFFYNFSGMFSKNFNLLSGTKDFKTVPIWVRDASSRIRHDLVISKVQRHFASLMERGYIDATYKMAPTGFTQLLTVRDSFFIYIFSIFFIIFLFY